MNAFARLDVLIAIAAQCVDACVDLADFVLLASFEESELRRAYELAEAQLDAQEYDEERRRMEADRETARLMYERRVHARSVPCLHCGALPGIHCQSSSGRRTPYEHSARTALAFASQT